MVSLLDIYNISIRIFRFHGIAAYADNVIRVFIDTIFGVDFHSGGYVGKLYAGSCGGYSSIVGIKVRRDGACDRLLLKMFDCVGGFPGLGGAVEFPVKDNINGLLAMEVKGAVFFYKIFS